jgi:hypothetical protein
VAAKPLPVPPLPAGTLAVRQNVCGNAASRSAITLVEVGSIAPTSPPKLTIPSDGAVNIDLRGPAQWQPGVATACAVTHVYWLQVCRDPDFNVFEAHKDFDLPACDNEWIHFYSGYPGLPLAGTTYFWRVRAQRGKLFGPWSARHVFTTKRDQHTTQSPGPAHTLVQDFQFIEDCCASGGNFRRAIVVTAAPYDDAKAIAEDKALNDGRAIRDYDASLLGPCSQP